MTIKFTAAVLLLIFCIISHVRSQATLNFTSTISGATYLVFNDKILNWENAQNECFMSGGHLASIDSLAENSEIIAAAASLSSELWIGFNSRAVQGQFRWSDRSAVNITAPWASGEPDELESHRCVVMDTITGEWSTTDCGLNHGFICKLSLPGQCPWDLGNAPRPVVEYGFDQEEITLRVRLARRALNATDVNATVHFQVKFASEYEGAPSLCLDSNEFNADLWVESLDDCVATYTLKLPVDEFVARTNATLSRDSQSWLQVNNLVYLVVMDASQVQNSSCVVTVFQGDIEFKTLISAAASVGFNATMIAFTPDITTFSLNSEGKLVVDMTITPSEPEYWFSNFRYGAHSRGIIFDVESAEEDCADAGLHLSCSYHVTFVSQQAEASYSGVVLIWFDFNFLDEFTTNTTLFFHLRYTGLSDANVVSNIITTSTRMMNSNFSSDVSIFTPFARTHMLTETDRGIQIPNSKLVYDDVFLCCTKANIPLAVYNPSSNNFGCTVRDDNLMSFWGQLVVDGVANAEYLVEIEDFGPLERNRIGMSFNPIGLYGDDKLCYLHTKARIAVEGDSSSHSRAVHTKGSSFALESTATFMVQSCSAFTNKDSCLLYKQFCDWRYGVQVCVRKETAHAMHEGNGAASMAAGSMLMVALTSVALFFIALF